MVGLSQHALELRDHGGAHTGASGVQECCHVDAPKQVGTAQRLPVLRHQREVVDAVVDRRRPPRLEVGAVVERECRRGFDCIHDEGRGKADEMRLQERLLPFLHGRGNVISHNEVFAYMLKQGDGNAIYVAGCGPGMVRTWL